MFHRVVIAASVLATAAVLIACGGGDKNSGSTAPSGNGPTGAGATVSDRVDLGQSLQNIEKLQSFRFDLSMKIDAGASAGGSGDAFSSAILGALGNIKASGSVVMPDQAEMSITLLGEEFRFVQIGNRAWMKVGNSWQPTSAESLQFGSPNELFADVIPADILKGAKTSREKVNGVDAVRYSFDKKALEQLASDFGEVADLATLQQANLDIWLNADNIPVKMTMSLSGKDEDGQKVALQMEMNIKDINDPSIKIKPPV